MRQTEFPAGFPFKGKVKLIFGRLPFKRKGQIDFRTAFPFKGRG